MAISVEEAISALRPLVSKTTLSSLVKEVIEAGKDKESEVHGFYRLCNNWVATPGFRRGSEKPTPLLVKSSTKIINRHNEPFAVFLMSLLKAEHEGVQEIRGLIEVEFPAKLEKPPECIEEFYDVIDAISKRVRETMDIDWDTECLSLIIGAILALPSKEREEAAISLKNPVMKAILEELESLPAEDPFWSHLEEFFEAVTALQAAKTKISKKQEQIQIALDKLDSQYRKQLEDYFQLSITRWTIERVIPGKEEFILEQLSHFEELLTQHKETSMEAPKTMLERRQISEKLHKLESEISNCYSKLNECFADLEPEPDSDSKLVSDRSDEEFDDRPIEDTVPVKEEEEESVLIKEEEESTISLGIEEQSLPEAPLSEVDSARQASKDGKEVLEKTPAFRKDAVPPEPIVEREDLVLEMIRAGDLSGAYWKARALEHNNRQSSVPSWLIAAMEGSRYLLKTDFKLFRDFTYPLKYSCEGQDRFVELTALGVGLIGTLLVPASGSVSWLSDQEQMPNLQKTITAIREFSYRNIPLSRRDLLALSSHDEREQAIVEAARNCQSVVNTNTGRRFGLPRVNKIWKEVFGDQSELRATLEKVGSDRREEIKQIQAVMTQWSTRDKIVAHIQSVDAQLLRKKDTPLAGYERDRIMRIIDEVVDAAEEWITLVEHTNNTSSNWKQEHIEPLIRELKVYIKPSLSELEEACKTANGAESIGFRFIQENLRLLLKYITRLSSNPKIDGSWYLRHCESIEEVLAKRLLWYPELELLDNGLPTDHDLHHLLVSSWEPNPRWYLLKREIYNKWLDKQDHRFLDKILAGLDVEESVRDDLRTLAMKQLQGSRDTLAINCQETVENIERALVNGVISEEQRVGFVSVVENIVPSSASNFMYELAKLRKVDQELSNATQLRIRHLHDIWAELSPRLEEIAEPEEAASFRNSVQSALDEGDTRVVDELLAKVRDHLERGEDLGFSEMDRLARDYLQEFYDFRQALDRYKEGRFRDAWQAAKQKKSWATLHYGNISPKQLDQTFRAFNAWLNLAQKREKLFNQSITDLFTFLGFSVSNLVEEINFHNTSGSYLHLPLKMEASDQARPFPHFGSLAEPTFNVLMVWERPGADNLGTAVHEARLGAQSTILLYFGRIGDSVRQEITRMTRRRSLPIAILDETLLLYLTGERDARLRAFLRCSVPYGTVIPYTPRIIGDVPPEIFYGREEAVKELQRKDGSCLLYGGRQMGKSALLRQIRRQAHNPERRQYAWVEDVKTLGDSYSNEKPSKIWTRFWELLFQEGLVTGRVSNDDDVITGIERLLRREQDLQIILMLDEADNFLNQDALEGFKTVTILRKLMTDSERRFKVIFAGLQHVQRFQSLPNQPLAHFGAPILVGPLEGHAAIALVREPLEALGFQLDDSCVYRILSFTNYHPGLIQIFCYHLLERLYKRMAIFPVPHKPLLITSEDVDSIYMQEEVREGIRERFEWTLALDERYQVITWAMIVTQTHDRDSFSRKFSVGELFDLARDYWAAEFDVMTNDEFRGLLQELSGLGVLNMTQGKYRLKSPNLVRLMGTEEDIENRLYDFVDKPARMEMEPDSFHHLIDKNDQIYSAFTFEQARNIDRQNDYRVIMASQALGLGQIEESIKNFYTDLNKTATRRVAITVDSADEMNKLIDKERDRAKKRGFENLVL